VVFKLLALLPLLVAPVFAADVFIDLPITNVTVSPDGFERQAIQAGTFPGDHILVQAGDVLHINVSMEQLNPSMRRSTVIHWHGLFQERTGSEDGPAFVNQCPIANDQFYVYDYPLDNQTGTFWFHSHLSTQYVDGERGVLVIYDPNDPLADLYDVDDDSTIIALADWYHTFAELAMDQFRVDGVTPVPSSGLINGVGRYVGGPEVPWPVFTVEQGKRYRFRVADVAGYAGFTVSIDEHVLTIIETDGIETVPFPVTSFDIFVAQRYSFVLNATQPVDNYWIRAPMIVAQASDNPDLDVTLVKAILRYVGAPDADPTTSALVPPVPLQGGSGGGGGSGSGSGSGGGGGGGSQKVGPLQEFQLATLVNPGAPGGDVPPDQQFNLTFNMAAPGVWEINGIVYTPPELPTLLKIINGATVSSDFNISEHTFILEENNIIELNIHGSDHGIIHPFHLHGHAFDIVQSASGPLNFVNPPRRDVIAVEQGGVTIRFRADNPGPWFLHCHIDWHLEAGLAVVFAEDPAQARTGPQAEIIKPTWLDLCPAYYDQPVELQRRY